MAASDPKQATLELLRSLAELPDDQIAQALRTIVSEFEKGEAPKPDVGLTDVLGILDGMTGERPDAS